MDDVITFLSRDKAFRRHERSFRRIVFQLGELERRDPRWAKSRNAAKRLLHRAEASSELARRLAELTGYKDDFQLWEEAACGKHGDVWDDFRREIAVMKSKEIRQDINSTLRSMELSAAQEDPEVFVEVKKLQKWCRQ